MLMQAPRLLRDAPGGIELLMIGGSLTSGGDVLKKNDWLRLPEGEALSASSRTRRGEGLDENRPPALCPTTGGVIHE